MKRALICDLDGSLVVSVGLHEKAWQNLFGRYGITLTKAELKEQSGRKNLLFIDLTCKRRGRTDLDPQKLSDEKDEMVITILEQEPAIVYPHTEEMLRLLFAHGIDLILATSATRSTAWALAPSLIPIFSGGIFAEDVVHGKPDPEIFLKAAARLGLQPSDCAVLEDAESGVQAAKAGGFLCIARDNGLGQDLSGADLIVTDFDPVEILHFLENN